MSLHFSSLKIICSRIRLKKGVTGAGWLFLFLFLTHHPYGMAEGGQEKQLFMAIQEPPAALMSRDLPHQAEIRRRYARVRFDLLQRLIKSDLPVPIELNLFGDLAFSLVKKQWKSHNNGLISIFGGLENVPMGNTILVVDGETLTGNIYAGKFVYEVRYLGDGVHVVRQVDPNLFPPEAPPQSLDMERSPPEQGMEGGKAGEMMEGSQEHEIIDLLVVYTEDAANATGNILAEIQLAVDETNLAYENSAITQSLRLVHTAEIDYLETGSVSVDMRRLQSPDDGYMDDVHSLRDSYGADVVSLFVENTTSSYIGYAYTMTSRFINDSFAAWAFSAVVRRFASTGYTLAHELGHNMGACHDHDYSCTCTGAYSFSHGYYESSGFWRTIMACSKMGSPPKIPYFSNPDVSYGGLPTGVPEGEPYKEADNARTLNNTAPIVSQFRVAQSIPPTVITGSATLINSRSATLNGTVNPNGLSTTFVFEYGTDTHYGNTTSAVSAGVGVSSIPMSMAVSGLMAETIYHFRGKGKNSAGTTYGNDQTFTTPTETIIYVTKGHCGDKTPCFATIEEAIAEVDNVATIRISGEIYDEAVILDEPKDLIFQGGWDATFTSKSSCTLLTGSIIIKNGKVTVENLVLQ